MSLVMLQEKRRWMIMATRRLITLLYTYRYTSRGILYNASRPAVDRRSTSRVVCRQSVRRPSLRWSWAALSNTSKGNPVR